MTPDHPDFPDMRPPGSALPGPDDRPVEEPWNDHAEPTREFNFGDDESGGRRGKARNAGRRPEAPAPRTTSDGRRVPRTAKQRRPAWQRIAMTLGAALALLLIVTGGVRAAYSGKALPGTTIGGEAVGGQTEDELADTVRRLASPDRRLNLAGPDRALQVSARGGGLEADVDATVQAALDARRGSFFSPLVALASGASVPLVAEVDASRLKASVTRIAKAVDRTPYAGAISIDPESLGVTTTTSKPGREVDQQELTELLRTALLRPRAGTIEIPVQETKAVSASGVQDVADDAEAYLRSSLKMTGAGSTYTVSPEQLAKLLALEPVSGGQEARLGVDSGELSNLTERVAKARDRAARSAVISAPARGPIVDGKAEVSWKPKSAKVTVTREGRSGLAVVVKELNTKVRSAVRKGEHTLKVPTKTTAAPVSQASAKKIDRVIGTFSTAYVAGQPRVTNIQRIARAIDRTVIAPGAQFSLNGIAGERTKAKGYVEAPFIAGNKIEPSIGGGVSQFSTTMYNAAYFAGLQIDAHQPHSLYIDRYPAGRESTLNFPDIDMKWTNDTGTPILIRTYADSAGVTVTLYGNNGGREVQAIPGDRQPNPGGNFAITVTRVIKYKDGRTVRQPSTTKYANEVVDEAPQE